MYSMKIAVENERAYKISLIKKNLRTERVLFEFVSERIPSVDKVLKLYKLTKGQV